MSRTGADLVASALEALGVRHAFAIVSIHNMPMLDAINRLGFNETHRRAARAGAARTRPTDMRGRRAKSA